MHHTLLRGAGQLMFKKLFGPVINKKEYTDEDLEPHRLSLLKALDNMEMRL